jgi:alpha-galactosidase
MIMAQERFKLAYIGAGSFRFSGGFFRNIINAKEIMPMEVALCDINEKSLKIMTKILQRMVNKAALSLGYDANQIQVTSHVNYQDALENADFVYKSISVGIQEAEWFDNYLPIKFGIPQNTGDTCGPGGLFRGLRTNPVCADIARTMKKLCPKATLLNYTNPQASIVMAARTAAPEIQFIGLCHELFGGGGCLKKFANEYMNLDVKDWNDMDLEYGGINHFGWFTKINFKGTDIYPALREKSHELILKKYYGKGFNFYLLEKHGWFCYPGSRHVAEFMTDYYNYFNHVEQSPYWSFPVIRDVWNLSFNRRSSYTQFKLMAAGIWPVQGPRKEGERAMEMTMDWKDSIPHRHVVNIPNTHPDYQKIIPELPDDCVVEIPGYFKNQKVLPINTIHMPKEAADLVRPHAEQTRYTVNAALGNDFKLVVKAMLHDPMASWIEDKDKLEYLTKLMLFYQQQWLPKEWKQWIPSESELKESKWWVSKKDLSKVGSAYKKVMFPPEERLKQKAFFWKE